MCSKRSLVKQFVALIGAVALSGCFTFGSAVEGSGTGSSRSGTGTGGSGIRPYTEPPGGGNLINPVPVPNPNEFVDLKAGMNDLDNKFTEFRDPRWTPVYFAFNQHFIGDSERPKLTAFGEYLKGNPTHHALLEGHCDERGSEEYNRGLGERRALAAKDFLVKLGIAAERLRTISYGEERPADTRDSEEAHSRNRRAEFVILLPRE